MQAVFNRERKACYNMQKITRETIKHLASSETVYFRGMRYYAAHTVSNVTWNEGNRQYKGFVKGNSQYMVTIQADGGLVYSCNCPAHVKYNGACKHVVAMLLFISDYQQRETAKETFNDEDKAAYHVIEYFRKMEYQSQVPEYFHLEIRVNIPSFMNKKDTKAYISFMAGSSKMYIVPNIKKFIEDYCGERQVEFGRQSRYIPGECEFDSQSASVLGYLIEIYEIHQMYGRQNSGIFCRNEIIVTQNMLCKLLYFAEGLRCRLKYLGNDYTYIKITRGNPELSLSISLKDGILEAGNAGNKVISLCEDGSILYYNGSVYLPDKQFIGNLLPFYLSVFNSTDRTIRFSGTNKDSFIEKVLPVIKKYIKADIPQEIKDSYIIEKLVPRLYLDIDKYKRRYTITATVKFIYGAYEINPLGSIPAGSFIIIRDWKEEERLTILLETAGFKAGEGNFLLDNEEQIFGLVKDKARKLSEDFEIFYSKEYKRMSVKKPGRMSANIKINTDINLLEINLGYSHIPKEETDAFFNAVKLKKKYYRLKDGTFINLLDKSIIAGTLGRLLEDGSRAGNGILQFNSASAAYIDKLMPDGSNIKKDEIYLKLINDINHPGNTVWEVPDIINATLRDYQKTGYQWLKTLAKYGMGGILADDMGLGKTLQAIIYICSDRASRSLIVCPASLSYNWQEEFMKFAPSVKTCIVAGTPEERKDILSCHMEEYEVWITTYPVIRKDVAFYKDIKFDNMFIDEAQSIKNPASLGAKAVKCIKAKHKFALTGTPVENRLAELWSIFDFIMPGYLGRYPYFSEYYEKPVLNGNNEERREELRFKIQPFILRRMKKDVLKDLPDKIETKIMPEMTSKQRKIYLSYLLRVQPGIRDGSSFDGGKGRMQVLAALTRLRQICCHPSVFIDNYTGGSGKMELLMEQLPGLLDAGHSVIIFSQFTSMLSIIADTLYDNQIPFFYLSGATKTIDRKRYVEEFNQGSVKLFLISLKAGGTGLNLTGADTVIHFDPWWNPAVENQATDRAYRIGQKKKVNIIKYVMKDSIEEKIYELQKRKKLLSDSVIEAEEIFVNQLTKEEIAGLFE